MRTRAFHLHGRYAAWLLILAAPCLLLACKTGPYTAKAHPPVLEDTETLVLLDKPLQKNISVEGQRAGYTPEGRLVAEAKIRNLTKDNLSIQAQTIFKDDAGMSSGDESAWQTMLLNPNAMETYRATALNANSKKYTIRVRLTR